MKTRFGITLLPFLIALAGCATQGSLESTRNDMNSVKTRLFSVEKDLGGIRDESKERMDSLEKEIKTEVAAIRKIAADTQATSDGNKNEIQALNGRLDDLAGSIKKPNEDLTRYREDADKRIITLEDRIVKLQAALDELAKKAGETPQPKELPVTPDAMYLKGLETFKAGDLPAAREQFTKFIEQNPKHDLVANARYWIGETLFGEKNYEAAIVAFQDVIANYPKQPKVSAAMLKQARAFKAINDPKSAKYVLKKLIETYPKSDEAKKGREFLKEIK
ncbi:MAG: tol-pal system protein YbgF [Desulfuromonadales bacterium]|nr:tol-pal system protein YbgF [Desulfuromonadales bacterium]